MTDNTSTILRRGWSVFGKLVAGTRKGPSGDRVRLLKKFQKQVGIRFLDLSLLEQALTHRSYSHVTSRNRDASNERMEFLGDSVLGLSVSQFLYLQFPDRPEGALSKMKSLLVSRKVLSEVSREHGLGEFILLSGEESDMGGRDRDSILADSYEGVIGAIYLDQGYRAASKFIQDTLLADINDILKDEENTNYKSLLQEYVQSRRLSHPVYRVHAEDGPEHEKEFVVDVVVKGEIWGQGRGKNKKDAEQAAAREAIDAHRRKTAAAARQTPPATPAAPASPASPPSARTPAPRTGRWRTGTAPAPAVAAGSRSGSRTSEAATPAAAEDSRHGIRASRDLLRASREAEAKTKDAPVRRGSERQVRRVDEPGREERGAVEARTEGRRPAEPRSDERRPAERRREEGAAATVERSPDERRSFGRRPGGEPRRGAPPASAPATPGTPATSAAPMAASSMTGEPAPSASTPSGLPSEGGARAAGSGRRRGRRGGRGRSRPGTSAATAEAGTTGAEAPELDLRRAPSSAEFRSAPEPRPTPVEQPHFEEQEEVPAHRSPSFKGRSGGARSAETFASEARPSEFETRPSEFREERSAPAVVSRQESEERTPREVRVISPRGSRARAEIDPLPPGTVPRAGAVAFGAAHGAGFDARAGNFFRGGRRVRFKAQEACGSRREEALSGVHGPAFGRS